MIIEDQKLNIYENKLMISGGAEQGFLNVFLFCEKYLIDKFDLERYLTIILRIIEKQKLNMYLISNIIWICQYVVLNIWIVWISFMKSNTNNLMISLRLKGGVELGFLNVFLFCEFDLERYFTIILMIIEKQKI